MKTIKDVSRMRRAPQTWRKSFFALCVFLLFAAAAPFARPAHAAGVDARGIMIMNLKSESVLYLQDADRKVPPASLAKIMTMYVIMDQLKAGKVSLSDRVRISAHAAGQSGATMGLAAGETVEFGHLVEGVAVASGNDASVAAAEHIAGSVQRFVKMMNDKSRSLGLKNTSFANPHGLPPAKGQWTTARDMLMLSKSYMETHPEAMRYHSQLSVQHGNTITTNKNKLLRLCPGADGIKTGWIRASGFNLVSTAKRDDIRILCVLLGASKSQAMTDESLFLVEAAFTTVESGGKNKVAHQIEARAKAEQAKEEEQRKAAKGAKGTKEAKRPSFEQMR